MLAQSPCYGSSFFFPSNSAILSFNRANSLSGDSLGGSDNQAGPASYFEGGFSLGGLESRAAKPAPKTEPPIPPTIPPTATPITIPKNPEQASNIPDICLAAGSGLFRSSLLEVSD